MKRVNRLLKRALVGCDVVDACFTSFDCFGNTSTGSFECSEVFGAPQFSSLSEKVGSGDVPCCVEDTYGF